jgi:hypothetical protein
MEDGGWRMEDGGWRMEAGRAAVAGCQRVEQRATQRRGDARVRELCCCCGSTDRVGRASSCIAVLLARLQKGGESVCACPPRYPRSDQTPLQPDRTRAA